MLSTSAFNALLKTIEEPPEYVVFIFATTETQKVPATIRSRCQQFHFQLIPLETIKQVLTDTAKEMGVNAQPDALFWIAKESTGSMRDAYTLFDQVVSFSDGELTLEKIHKKLGLVGLDQLSLIVETLIANDTAAAISSIQDLLSAGVSVEQCTKDFAEYFRTLLLLKKGIQNEDLLGVQPGRIPHTIRSAYTSEQLEAAMELFLQLYRDIRFSLSPRFELELAVSRLGSLTSLVSSTTLMQQLAMLKNDLISGKTTEITTQMETPTPRITVTRKDTDTAKIIEKPPIETIIVPVVATDSKPEPTKSVEPVKQKPAATVVIPEQEKPPVPVQPKPPVKITKDILPTLIQEMANERDPVGIILSQIIDVTHEEKKLSFVFSSRYAMETAKQHEEKLRSLIYRITGYEGALSFSVSEMKKTVQPEEKHKNDITVQAIANLFRGEII
jgi:DNA polymerase III subunit gamma/tau